MTKNTRTWLIVGVALIVIGAVLFAGTMAFHRWDFGAFGAKMETVTVDVGESFRNISIRSDTEDIVLRPSADGKCRVVFVERENESHTVSVQGDTLTVAPVETEKWTEQVSFFSSGSASITVWLPEQRYAALDIREDTGDITIPGDFVFESVDISASTGTIRCGASAVRALRLTVSTGDIALENAAAGELVLSVSTGHVTASGVDCKGSAEVKVSTGKAVLKDVTCESLTSSGSTGDLTLENVTAAGEISVRRSTGDVRLSGCDAKELTIQTTTGDVTGTLRSEKVFLVRSDTGRIRVPETTSGGVCRVTTDTGDIEINIA